MRILFRNFLLALLPLLLGLAASWGFAFSVPSCGRLVGPVFGPKCHWKQLEYQLLFQTGGTLLGVLIATGLGTWMELRRRSVVQRSTQTGEPS